MAENKQKYYAVQVLRYTECGQEIIKTIIVLASSPREAVRKTEVFHLHNQINWPQHNYDGDPPLVLLEPYKAKVKLKALTFNELCE